MLERIAQVFLYAFEVSSNQWKPLQRSTNGRLQVDSAKSSIACTNTAKTVTNSSAELVASNASRQYLLIQNKSASGAIYINFGTTATLANGVRLNPGDSYEMSDVISIQAINAIGSIASNPDVVVVEGV